MSSMIVSWKCTLLAYFILVVGYYVLSIGAESNPIKYKSKKLNPSAKSSVDTRKNQPSKDTMVVAVVSCGNRAEELLVLLKSVLVVSSNSSMRFIVFTDNKEYFTKQILSWKQNANEFIEDEIYDINYPITKGNTWEKYCDFCICHRLFFPELLPHIDSLIYVDADCIFLNPVETLWKHFQEFNSTQMVGMGPDHESYKSSPFGKYAVTPFFGNSGLNSGVMLMNLTRMRAFGWNEHINAIGMLWGSVGWMDQWYINTFFLFHPEKLYLLYCSANFRAQFCDHDPPDCTAAVRGGIQVLHGTGRDFHNGYYPAFTTVYDIVKQFRLGTNRTTYIFQPILKRMNSSCADAIIASIKMNQWAN